MSFTQEEKDKFLILEQIETASKSESFKLYSRIRDTRLPLYTLRHNYKDLFTSISKFHNHVGTAQFWDLPYLRSNIQKEISKNLFNYLSAACAIIDLSRRSARKLLSKPQQVLYFQNIKNVFVSSIEYRIIRNLRNYISHYSNPRLGVYSKWSLQETSKHAFYLHTSELLEWDEWDMEERNYLKTIGDKFEIEHLLRKYHYDFISTQDKFFHDVVRNHFKSLADFAGEVEQLIFKGKQMRIMNFPLRPTNLRWLKCVLAKIGDNPKNV